MILIPQYANNYYVIPQLSVQLLNKTILIIFWGCLFCTFFGPNKSFAQRSYINIQFEDEIPETFEIDTLLIAPDSLGAIQVLQKLRRQWVENGFLTAGFDHLRWAEDTVFALANLGHTYDWIKLGAGNVPEVYLTAIGFREKLYRNETFAPKKLALLFKKIIGRAENNGFPFATIHLDSIKLEPGGISGLLHLERKTYTRIDSLILKGNVRTNRSYIENYLGLKNNIPYNQSLLNKIPTRLKELPFLQVIKPYEIGMRPGKADVYLYLKPKKASNFNGILGILPDNETGKTRITGNIELNLLNSLKRGESINLKWQRLQTRTQELDIHLAYPFILNTPVGAELMFNLYRQDTLFSQVNSHLGLSYFFKGGNKVNVYYENHQANVISPQVFSIDKYIDSRTNMFGLGLEVVHLDYRFNPSKGYFLHVSTSAGVKKILKNPEVDESEYGDLKTSSDIYHLNLNAGTFIRLASRSTVLLRLRSASILNDYLFRNELFRIGGLKTLRGFDEQSIYASTYAIGTIEYRFILEENSNFFLFFDQGYYENRSNDTFVRDQPFGFGAGINFETKAGIFSFTYALGKQFDNQIEFRNGKIHFGFISFF